MIAQLLSLAAPASIARVLPRFLLRPASFWTALGFAVLAVGPQPARAAVTEAWVQRYSNVVSKSADKAFKVVRDAAGDIVVVGSTDDGITGSDMLTIKYSGADGSVLWQKRYNGPANGSDGANAVAVDGSGNVVVTGGSYGTNSNSDYYTAKYAAADGALLWEKRYNGPANSDDVAFAVALEGNGNVVVTGYSQGGPPFNYRDYYTAKYAAADGALFWEKRYNGPANHHDSAQAVAVDGSGNVVVTGYSYNANLFTDYYTAKYAAANGALLWEKRYNGPANSDDQATAVAMDGSGNVVVTGGSLTSNFNSDYYTAKYAATDGALLWEKRYDGPLSGYDQAQAVAVDGSGNVVVTGSSATIKYQADGTAVWTNDIGGVALALDGSGNVVVTGSSIGSQTVFDYDYRTAMFAAAKGALLWEKTYKGPAFGADQATAVAVDGSGNVVVTGASGGDYYTVKYAAVNGAPLWGKRYNGPSNGMDQASAVAVDDNGNVVVTGYSYNSLNSDYYTAKYAAANGALLWEKRYDGPANSGDRASGVAVDGSGNVVVTGYSNSGTDPDFGGDYYTAKYAALNGALLWEKSYDGPANNLDRASAVAVDGSGNVVVTGTSASSSTLFTINHDYYTAKYAAANGALLWENRYNGPANRNDSATAVAIDGSGNVLVTGYSYNTLNSDYYTAKYAASDGALLWEQRYNGPANGHDSATAVALDGSGNVVVTGYSSNDSSDNYDRSDYYTAKYAAADGALLWEKRYNGPANRSDGAKAVAVDGDGNVVVMGSSARSQFNLDYHTAKYAAADGALLWEKRYNGPANSEDVAAAVAVDDSGNVVVSGYSYLSLDSDYYNPLNSDYYTAKYAAANGALLWEKRYNGSANGNDSVTTSRSLALGPNGMVAITGASDGNFSFENTSDYATVVYREIPPPVSIAPDGTGGYFIRGSGSAGFIYQLQRATSATGPWTSNATITAASPGIIEFHDTNAPSGQAFYRTMQP